MSESRDPLLLIDVSNLFFRNFYGVQHTGTLVTGVQMAAMFLKQIAQLRESFASTRFVFCFDMAKSKRKEMYPQYKQNRDKQNQNEADSYEYDLERKKVVKAMEVFREQILERLGFVNVFFANGYEADDVIAGVARCEPGQKVIVSTDKDLYQLLDGNTVQWHPYKRETLTLNGFIDEYGITPEQWPLVKAMAGDSSDNIDGIPKVGIKTAIRFLCGDLPPHYKVTKSIIDGADITERNLKLILLPLPGTPRFYVGDNQVTVRSWNGTIEALGLKGIMRNTTFV